MCSRDPEMTSYHLADVLDLLDDAVNAVSSSGEAVKQLMEAT